jgi:hypothetical protein
LIAQNTDDIPHTLRMAYFLYCCSGKAYRFLKQLLPLPAVSQLCTIFQPTVLLQEQHFRSLDSLHHLVSEWRFREGLSSDSRIEVILGVDAATFQPDANIPLVELEVCKNGHLFFSMPLNPSLTNFSVHLRFLPSGSLGRRSSETCREIAAQLKDCKIDVLALASDGERASLKCYDALFRLYSDRTFVPMTELTKIINNHETWEIATPLHALKCQRCWLAHSLSFSRGSISFDAKTMNKTLSIEPPSQRLAAVDQMSDALAVALFTMQNHLKLEFAGQFAEFYYLLPSAMWFAAIQDPEIPLAFRQGMIEFCFRRLSEWLQPSSRGFRSRLGEVNHLVPFKYVPELPDLRRYLNSLLFLYKLLTTREGPLVLNRIGTHPVENMFGLAKIKCKSKHSFTAFLRVFSNNMMTATILKAAGLSSPVRRDYSIVGSKLIWFTDLIEPISTRLVLSSDCS